MMLNKIQVDNKVWYICNDCLKSLTDHGVEMQMLGLKEWKECMDLDIESLHEDRLLKAKYLFRVYRCISFLSKKSFLKIWHANAFLNPGLHPDENNWPAELVFLAAEAWRRYEEKQLTDEEFYCSDYAWQGLGYNKVRC